MTILRSQKVQARSENPIVPALHALSASFQAMFNGDLRTDSIQRYCVGECCEGQNVKVTVDAITALLTDVVFAHLGSHDSRFI